MADVRSALLEFLRTQGADASSLGALVDGVDANQARIAMKDDPGSVDALTRLIARLLVDGEATDAVVDAAKAAAQRAPRDASGVDVALVAGEVVWRLGGQAQAAEPYFRRVRRSAAAHPDLLAFYRELFSGEGDASQLMQVLVQARRAAKEAELRFSLASEMSTLATERLDSTDRAIEVWRAVLREDKEPRAIEHLERLYREGGKWTALVELLKERVESIDASEDNKTERVEKLLEIAEFYRDRLRLDAMALATLQRVVEIDPHHEGSLEVLAQTYEKAGRFPDLLGVYGRLRESASEAGDTAREIELLRRTASVWVDNLKNPQRALEPLQRVLELAPDDAEARNALASIHEQRRDFRSLVALRRGELAHRDGDDAFALRCEVARLSEERLGDRREAISDWNAVLEHHGERSEALEALSRLYAREGRWAEAAETLHRRLASIEGPENAVPLLTELGQIYGERLRDVDHAIAAWKELARLVPGHEGATKALRDAYVAGSRWDELTELYVGQGGTAALVDVLQAAADRVADVAERVTLYRRVADLCRDELGEPERALKALERTLAIAPEMLEVARELLPIYREQHNWARVMGTLERLLEASENVDDQLSLISDLREVAAEQLASPALTFKWSARAFALRPSDENLRQEVEQAAEHADAWDALCQTFEARAEATDDDAERLVLFEKLAITARDRLGKPDDAQRWFRRIVELDPTDSQAMAALEDIYTSTRRWDDLADVYRRRLDVTDDVEAKLDTLRGLARLQVEHVKDLDAAVETFRAVLELQPDDSGTLDSLADILRARGDWEGLADVLQKKLDLSGGTGQVPTLFELSKVRATRLRDLDRAIEGFLEILEQSPSHREAVTALEEIRAGDPTRSVPIMRGLLPWYRREKDRVKEAEAMEVLLAEEPGDETARVTKLQQLAGIYEQMPDRRRDALRIYGELVALRPAVWEIRQTLVRLARELGAIEEAVSAYAKVLGVFDAAATAAEQDGRPIDRKEAALHRDVQLELAAMLRDDLGRTGDAEEVFRQVLDRDETHQGAYEALEALLKAREGFAELVQLYRRRCDVVFNPREQRELLAHIIEISRAVLGDRDTAQATAEELLDIVPDDVPTIELLAGMYRQGDSPEEREKLEELLGRWAELMEDPAARHALMVQRAALRMQYLGDAFGALDLLGAVLGADPDHAEARTALEQLLDVAEVQMQVVDLLDPVYARANDHAGRIRILHIRRANAADMGARDEATTHLLEIARIEETERGDLGAAFAAARDAYLSDPVRQDTRDQVERLGGQLQRQAELVQVWRAALADQRVVEKTLRIELTQRVAQLLDEHLKDAVGARAAYVELLDLDPPDAEVAHRTVAALARLHLEAGDFIALVATEKRLLSFVDDPAQGVRIRLDIARSQLEALRDRVGAALTLAEVVDIDPANATALVALERLFEEEEEWGRLCEVLQHRATVAADPRDKAGFWARIGQLRRERLGDPHGSIGAWQSVLGLKVGRDESVAALRHLYAINKELERWPEVEDALRRLVGLSTDDTERVGLLGETAVVVGEHLGRKADALDLLRRVLDLAPGDARARAALGSYLESDATRDRAMQILQPLYEREQNWAGLLGLQELQARKQPSGRRRLHALLEVCRTHLEKLSDHARAFTVLCEALGEAADQPELAEVLHRVEQLGAAPERSEALLAAYLSTADHILDADLQRRVLRNAGEVALTRLSRLEEAAEIYNRVVELAPDDDAAADALQEIYVRLGNHQSLAELLVKRAERTDDSAIRDDALLQAAELHRTALADPKRAIELYERLSPSGLARPDVQNVLEPLYEASGRYADLATHLNRKLGTLRGEELVSTHLRLGQLYGEHLSDPEEGIRHLATALRLDPSQAVGTDALTRYLEDPAMRSRAATMLEPVFTTVQDWERLVMVQEVKLSESPDEDTRVRIMMRMARLREEQLEDLSGAFDAYARIFKEQPASGYVREQLARLAGVLEEQERYATLLSDFAADNEGDDTPEAIEIVREAADLWGRTLRRADKAMPLFQRLLDANPEDREAFDALVQVLTRGAMWRELVDAYWRDIDATFEVPRQVHSALRLAQVAEDALSDRDEAIRGYGRALEVDAEQEGARNRLESLLADAGRNEELLDLLRDRLARCTDADARVPVLLRIAELQADALGDPEGAIDTLESLFSDSPGEPDAVAALEKIAEARIDQRARAFATLDPIYESTGNTQRRVAVCEWRLSQAEDPIERHAYYRELAALLESLDNGEQYAFRALARALGEPGSESDLESLDAEIQRLADALGWRGALAEALATAADAERLADHADRRTRLLDRAARIQLEQNAPDVVVQILSKALALRGDDPEALELMDEALTRLGHSDQLRAVLEKRVEVVTDDVERVRLLRRLGTLLEDVLAQVEAASKAWRTLLEIEPDDTEALSRLSKSYEASGSTDELVDVLERRIESSADPGERRELRMRLASIHREARKDRSTEIDVLRSLLADAPSDEEAMASLSRALLAEERFEEAADVLQERATLAEAADRKAALVLEAARIARDSLEDPMGAVERYEQVLTLLPGQDGAVADLVGLANHPDVWERAVTTVRPHLEANSRFEELATVTLARASLSQDPEEVLTAWQELATIRHERLNDIAGSYEATMNVVDRVAAENLGGALTVAGRIAGELDRVADHVTALTERAGDADRDPEARVALGAAAARTSTEILADRGQARAILVPLVEEGIANAALCEQLEELARSEGDGELIVRALVELAQIVAGSEQSGPVLVRLGEARLAIRDLEGAVEAFRDALDLDARDAQAVAGLERGMGLAREAGQSVPSALLDALEAAYQSAGDTTGLANVTRARIESGGGGDALSDLQNLATLLERGGGSPAEALDAWGQVLARDAESSEAIERLSALSAEDPQLAMSALRSMGDAITRAREDGRGFAASCLAAARLALGVLNDGTVAKNALGPLIEDQPEHPEGLGLLVDASRAIGEPAGLREALTRRASATNAPDQAVALWREASELAESTLGDPQAAISDLRNLLDADDRDEGAWQRLLALLSGAGDHEALAEALTRRASQVEDPAARRELSYRLANLYANALERIEDAVSVYDDMIAQDPNDSAAMGELEVLLRRLERWADVRDLLEKRLEAAEESERVGILEQMARVAEDRLEDLTDAAESWSRILVEVPGHPSADGALERIYTREERWTDLAELLDARMGHARSLNDAERYRESASALAGLLAERLADTERAEAILEELLELDPSYVPAILSLAAVAESRGDDAGQRRALERAAALDPQGRAGADLHVRLARLAGDDRDAQRSHLERALGLDPGHGEASSRLQEMYEGENNWGGVAHLMEMRVARTEEEVERRRLQLERVDILMGRLSDMDGALRVLHAIYGEVQDDTGVNARIADALYRSGRTDEAAGMYAWLVEVESNGDGRRRNKSLALYLTRLAAIEVAQGRGEQAQQRLEEAYKIDTTNVETLLALGGLHEQAQRWADALKIYRSMLLQNADQSGLLRRGDIYMRLSNAHLGLEERPKAQAMLRRGLEEDPGHPDLATRLQELGG